MDIIPILLFFGSLFLGVGLVWLIGKLLDWLIKHELMLEFVMFGVALILLYIFLYQVFYGDGRGVVPSGVG